MAQTELERTVGIGGAVVMGLGSIVGTGVFVSIGIAAGITGPSVVLALGLAAILAGFNGLSSAQCAAAWPVSGGTYEYANRAVGPATGFTAGWMFLAAKSASAATAALGLSGYLLHLLGVGDGLRVPVAVGSVAAVTALVLAGLRRSNQVNTLVVGFTFAVLAVLVAFAVPNVQSTAFTPFLIEGPTGLFRATALMFVAYTGYGRIATLGEEVHDPSTTIPRAIGITLAVVLVLYVGVGAAAVGVLGADAYAAITLTTAAPLQAMAEACGGPALRLLVSIGAITAMVGVLLNLVLGLSRVALAMGRRGDLPERFASVTEGTPVAAVVLVGGIIGGLALLGDVRTTWTFSAFTVLVYYALTNLSAYHLPDELRRYPRWTAVVGGLGCLSLAFFVEPAVWLSGLALLAVGHVGRRLFRSVG